MYPHVFGGESGSEEVFSSHLSSSPVFLIEIWEGSPTEDKPTGLTVTPTCLRGGATRRRGGRTSWFVVGDSRYDYPVSCSFRRISSGPSRVFRMFTQTKKLLPGLNSDLVTPEVGP